MSAFADQNHAPSLTCVRLESSVHFCDFKIYEVNELMKQKNGFSGQLGFVFAAAGSAVGVGNLWRFPYLAAKDGGGLFLIIYLILVFTVGFTLLHWWMDPEIYYHLSDRFRKRSGRK